MNVVFSIINPHRLDTLTAICKELDIPVSVTMLARGTAVQSMLDIMGIASTERRIHMSIASQEQTEQLIRLQKQHLYIGVPGHGIVLSVPIKSIGGGKTVAFLNRDQAPKPIDPPAASYPYELIIVITNEGRTDMVMNAARSVGATGGTILHGKGTLAKEAEKFFNVSIANEKEVVLIVSRAEQKTEIMRTILQKAGPGTEAGSILFSLPINNIAGFGLLED
ncbi:MAG: P-II family nitrogen regulator [Ruminococcaceae bacterium]|nr:P-II family nitrogen regulator [Oscillospiraceae bacterium]